MKKLRLLPVVLALTAFSLSASAADKLPTLPIDQALKIAQDYLAKHGAAGDHQLIGLTLESATAHSTYWYAHWSPGIEEGNRKQTGLRIEMDGSITLFVTAPGGANELPAGQRPVGARSIR